jgi:1-deoxy-D-xylulose-5-phosphate reductoisomerase
LDLWKFGKLTFYQPDPVRFPCLRLAYEALDRGGTCPAILNAANEAAVDAFLYHGLPFGNIANVIERTVQCADVQPLTSLEDALEADRWAREKASEFILN